MKRILQMISAFCIAAVMLVSPAFCFPFLPKGSNSSDTSLTQTEDVQQPGTQAPKETGGQFQQAPETAKEPQQAPETAEQSQPGGGKMRRTGREELSQLETAEEKEPITTLVADGLVLCRIDGEWQSSLDNELEVVTLPDAVMGKTKFVLKKKKKNWDIASERYVVQADQVSEKMLEDVKQGIPPKVKIDYDEVVFYNSNGEPYLENGAVQLEKDPGSLLELNIYGGCAEGPLTELLDGKNGVDELVLRKGKENDKVYEFTQEENTVPVVADDLCGTQVLIVKDRAEKAAITDVDLGELAEKYVEPQGTAKKQEALNQSDGAADQAETSANAAAADPEEQKPSMFSLLIRVFGVLFGAVLFVGAVFVLSKMWV